MPIFLKFISVVCVLFAYYKCIPHKYHTISEVCARAEHITIYNLVSAAIALSYISVIMLGFHSMSHFVHMTCRFLLLVNLGENIIRRMIHNLGVAGATLFGIHNAYILKYIWFSIIMTLCVITFSILLYFKTSEKSKFICLTLETIIIINFILFA
jgi:hypothetical protein